MLEHVYTDPLSGLDLRIQYTHNPFGMVEYEDIRTLDGNYRPVGPNLVDFFATQYSSLGTDAAGDFAVTPTLAVIAEDLD